MMISPSDQSPPKNRLQLRPGELEAVTSTSPDKQRSHVTFDLAERPHSGRPSVFKSAAVAGLRMAHRVLASHPLPDRIGIYFHALGAAQWEAMRTGIEHFLSLGYRAVTPSQFVAARLGERCLFVSFDDNFREWHDALPLFRSLGITATFYVNTLPFRDVADIDTIARFSRRLGMLENCDPLTRDELRRIRDDGHTIGCHSHSHFLLSQLPEHLWDGEIAQSKAILERLLGEPVTDFAWPYGMRRHFSGKLRSYCRSLGFSTIANAISGCQAVAADDPLDIYRTQWRLDAPLEENLADLKVDGRLYTRLTGRGVLAS